MTIIKKWREYLKTERVLYNDENKLSFDFDMRTKVFTRNSFLTKFVKNLNKSWKMLVHQHFQVRKTITHYHLEFLTQTINSNFHVSNDDDVAQSRARTQPL